MNLTKIRRKLKWFKLYMGATFNTRRRDDRIKLRSGLTDAELTAVTITKKAIFNPDSKLYYNTQTHECCVYRKYENETSLYIFIESGNIKIINTVFGYDISIDSNTEHYITNIFSRELAKRRAQFKREALAKVEFSLHKVLDKINEQYDGN
jgi:hypothetical protein